MQSDLLINIDNNTVKKTLHKKKENSKWQETDKCIVEAHEA